MWLPSKDAASLEVEEVVRKLDTNISNGLTWSEANRRKTVVGLNEFVVKEEEPLWRKYLEQFQN